MNCVSIEEPDMFLNIFAFFVILLLGICAVALFSILDEVKDIRAGLNIRVGARFRNRFGG